jgi:hypothetical protein
MPFDWFVAPTGAKGDGSRERPFHDPWVAIRRAEPGDTIHIAAGSYYGRLDRSSWIIEAPKITVLGGYSRDFTTRTPWQTPSVLGAYSGYEYARENNLIGGRGTHDDLVLDGLCFDSAGRNQYPEQEGAGIGRMPRMDGPIASFNGDRVTIRNCVFTNSASGGVELSGSSSRFENNLLINIIGPSMLGLRSRTQVIEKPIVVRGNSFVVMHDLGEPAGAGGPQGHGIIAQCPAVIESNLFYSCGNSGISNYVDPDRIAIERNVTFATPRDFLEHRVGGQLGEIKEKNLEELEDLGFKACAGNAAQDPAITGLPAWWVDAYTRDLFARYKTPPREAANVLRAAAQLPALTPPDVADNDKKGGLAPRFPISAIATYASAAKAGFHAVDLPVSLTPRPAPASPDYRRIEYPAMVTPDASLANARVELRVGLGSAQNQTLLADATSETHMGVRVYKPGSDDDSFYVLIPRYSFPSRQYDEARNYQRGMDVEKTYYLRGVVRTDTTSTRQKATMIVESIAPAPAFAPPIPPRPEGRDWFVRAGSTGGDGSREKPFRDPFQALEKAEGGDTVHVAGGDYFGKLRSGKWLLTIRHLALLGGYDAEFKTRDPWANPTRFALDAEEKAKGRPSGKILYSEENSDGLILDGFIFDGATWNSYKNGSLDVDTSPIAPLIQIRGNNSPVTIRNCLFLNASDSAVDVSTTLLVFENNVIVNTNGDGLVVSVNAAGPAVIRNNTMLFACDPTERAGSGQSSARGTMIQLKGRGTFELESNVIGFADNYGIRAAVPQDNVTLKNNVFAANLFNHLCDCQYLFADESNWARRVEADSSYILEGNKLAISKWPVDPPFLDLALQRLFQLLSRIKADQWKTIAETTGATVKPEEEKSAAAPAAASAPAPASAASTGNSIADIMARLNGTAAKLKEAAAAAPPPATAEPMYCPVYDYRKALAFWTEGADNIPGAHKKKLDVVFHDARIKPQITYTPVKAADLDAQRESLSGKPIEILVRELRDSASNPSSYSPGTDSRNFSSYGVAAAEEAIVRTRLYITIPLDTDVSKRIRKVVNTDKLIIRGTAFTTQNKTALSILVDSFDIAGT